MLKSLFACKKDIVKKDIGIEDRAEFTRSNIFQKQLPKGAL